LFSIPKEGQPVFKSIPYNYEEQNCNFFVDKVLYETLKKSLPEKPTSNEQDRSDGEVQ
jgi:hypothetical protein